MPVSPVPPSEPPHGPQSVHDLSLAGWGHGAAPLPPIPTPLQGRTRQPWWVWSATTVGVCAVIAVVVVGVLYFATDLFEEKHGGLTERQAQGLCEEEGKDRLKAPTTAIFEFRSVDAGDDGWDLRGRVSSQNGYGAMVAENFRCFTHDDYAIFSFNSD